MTTCDILSRAYAQIFGIAPDENGCYCDSWQGAGHFHDQNYSGVIIDYADFDELYTYEPCNDIMFATTEEGCEGVYIGVYARRTGEPRIYRIGLIKTLKEGRAAWRTMGALAGELLYMAQAVVYELYTAEQNK